MGFETKNTDDILAVLDFIRTVRTIYGQVGTLAVRVTFSKEPINRQLTHFAEFTCICFALSNFFSVNPFAPDMSFVVRSHIFARSLNIHKLF
jgi:hypothetical protein